MALFCLMLFGCKADSLVYLAGTTSTIEVQTKDGNEVVEFVLHDLHSGATINEIIGAYDKTPRREMITIVDKHEYRRLMDFVRQVDPKAFVTVYAVSDMRSQPKK